MEFTGPKTKDFIYNYTDANGLQYAIIGPYAPATEEDWMATTIGVSTKCSALPPSGCTRGEAVQKGFVESYHQPFNCSVEQGAPFNISGNITGFMHDIFYFDFHKYLRDEKPFNANLIGWDDPDIHPENVTDDEEVFKNPWTTLSQATIEVDRPDYPEALNDTSRLWLDPADVFDYTMLMCTTTGKLPPES